MNRIKELMIAKGVDEQELCERTGFELSRLNKILQPDYSFKLSPKTIELISSCLRLTKEENFSIYVAAGVIPDSFKDAFIHKPIAARAAILIATLNDTELELMEEEGFFDSMILALKEKVRLSKATA